MPPQHIECAALEIAEPTHRAKPVYYGPGDGHRGWWPKTFAQLFEKSVEGGQTSLDICTDNGLQWERHHVTRLQDLQQLAFASRLQRGLKVIQQTLPKTHGKERSQGIQQRITLCVSTICSIRCLAVHTGERILQHCRVRKIEGLSICKEARHILHCRGSKSGHILNGRTGRGNAGSHPSQEGVSTSEVVKADVQRPLIHIRCMKAPGVLQVLAVTHVM
mmetsp:Transcript_24780/g.65051  ORF Transcript_24780/g.65051 Transcript_24780/m.65051 type:complete len:219 (-) Transcript_24780:610-1266(-)